MYKFLTVLILLALVVAAPAQVAGKAVRGSTAQSSDNDNSGVLPLTMPTPYGTAHLYVHESGLAVLSLNGMLWVELLVNMPLPPGMNEATVDSGLCDVVYIPNPLGLPTIVSAPLGPSTGPCIEAAVAAHKAKMANAVGELLPCP